ncbi:MAG TPA: hypothetical protein VJ246_01660 [Patescibacteria group bacterium]|nr:hypothetical protein [Patescibacteria group bacterium]
MKREKQSVSWEIVFVLLIIVLTGVFRLWKFPFIPGEINRDEAALGYNAYSLLKTGKDEWGVSWPIVFRSFGDYKLAGYIYLLIPFVQSLGLTAFAVRLPSLLFGLMLIPVTYLFVKTVTKDQILSSVSVFILASSPWAIHYSRIGFEANVALVLFVLGLTMALRALEEKRRSNTYTFFSALFIGASLLTYNAPLLLLVPYLGLLLVLKKISLRMAVVLVMVGIGIFLLILPATRGKTGITLFTDRGVEQARQNERAVATTIVQRVVSNPVVYYPMQVAQRYIQSFGPTFLVIRGGQNPWHQPPDQSHFTGLLYVLAGFGLAMWLWSARKLKGEALLLGFVLLAPIPAIITVDAPHATRSLILLLLLSVAAAVPVAMLLRKQALSAIAILLAISLFSSQYLTTALRRFETRPQPEWNMGMREAIELAEQTYSSTKYPITMVGNIHFDYIYPLFYTSFDPRKIKRTDPLSEFGHYRLVQKQEDAQSPTVLLVREKLRNGEERFTVKVQ